VIPTLVAGTAFLVLAASVVSRYGLVGGIPWLVAAMVPVEGVLGGGPQLVQDRAKLLAVVVSLLVAIGIVVLSTWGSQRHRDGDQQPRFEVPAPATGLVSVGAAAGTSALAGIFGFGSSALFPVSALAFAGMVGVLTNLPAHVLALWNRALREPLPTPDFVTKHVRVAIGWGLGLTAALVLVNHVPRLPDVFWTTVLVALLFDGVSEFRARGAGDLVAVFPEHRPYAVPIARELLAAEGIELFVRSRATRPLFSFFGPYVPMDLCVRKEDAARATKLLGRLLKTDEKAVPKKARLAGALSAPDVGRRSRQFAGVAALIVFAGGAAWALEPHDGHDPAARAKHRAHRAKVRGSLGLYALDDHADEAVEAVAKSLPAGMSLEVENAPIGGDKHTSMPFVRAWKEEGESLREVHSRLSHWIDTEGRGALPREDRFAIGEYDRYDPGVVEPEQELRTYVLAGGPVLTEENVVDAYPKIDRQPSGSRAYVMVELDAAGAKTFEAWTGSHVNERFAIVTNGEVMSAPVIQSRIGGGTFQITMGAINETTQLEKAKELASALGGDSDAE
jgi:hypothetical protein